ncbi:quinol:electron acceptor oxidoreductase subunit ActD [Undibacterium sp. Di27W]|uniref:quinol:electron acceptor oxidoreductase subunit ActD n=1 Tax=Undibacterium sp. Di27W TaxID=3413036 RepID=UPI003BF050E1
MKNAVYCIAKNRIQAETIVENLKIAGLPSQDISVLFPDQTGSRDFAHEQNTKLPEGAAAGGVAGMSVGAILGWLTGIGSLAIPGVGPFIAAGPIMAALGGAALGTAAGGIIGALVGMGIPEYEAKLYDGKIRDGNILISVHTDNSDQVHKTKDIYKNAGAEDINSTSEASVPS